MVPLRPKNLTFIAYPKPRNIEEIATRASNNGAYTVDSEVRTVHYFFENGSMILGTPNGELKISIDKAERIAKELVEIIPEVRHHTDSGRRIMDSRAIGKMLERDFQ